MDEFINVKQTIMEKALVLFSEKGYEGVSVSELTAASGITKPTLYYYFGNKEGVFDSVCQANYALLNAQILKSAVYQGNPASYYDDIYKTLIDVAVAYFTFAVHHETFYRFMMANLSMPRSSSVYRVVEKYHFEQYEIVRKMFQNMAQSHGNLIGKDKQLAWAFIGAINAYIGLTFHEDQEHMPQGEMVKSFVRQFMHGIYV